MENENIIVVPIIKLGRKTSIFFFFSKCQNKNNEVDFFFK